jgi:hypothetical protein
VFLTIYFKLSCAVEQVQSLRSEKFFGYLHGILVLVELTSFGVVACDCLCELDKVVDFLLLDIIDFLIFRFIVNVTRERVVVN